MTKCTKCGKELAPHNAENCICVDCWTALLPEERTEIEDVEF